MSDSVNVSTGLGLGNLIAVIISFMVWKHIGWAILHGILGWFYVFYYLIKYGFTL
jgi:hypothetical protein